MLTLPVLSLLSLLSLSSPSTASFLNPHSGNSNAHSHHQFRRIRRQLSTPSTLAPGSLSVEQGCEAFYQVPEGAYCLQVAQQFSITLEEFYEWNSGVSQKDCPDLLAGASYCVKGPASVASTSAVPTVVTLIASTSTAPLATSTVAPSTTRSPVVASTTAVIAAASITSNPALAEATASATATDDGEDDDDDDECDADDDDGDSADVTDAGAEAELPATTSSATPTSTVSPTTTVVAAAVVKATTTSSAQATQTASVASSASASLAKLGVKSLVGDLTGALASWYNADSSTDSTNGHSWCGYPYSNDSPIFAPPIALMLQDFGGDYESAATAYCGLEAIVKTPDGKQLTLLIGDAFDMTWVRTTYAIDIMHNSFNTLFGSSTDNKDDVIQNVTWELTGNVNSQWKFKSTGSG